MTHKIFIIKNEKFKQPYKFMIYTKINFTKLKGGGMTRGWNDSVQ